MVLKAIDCEITSNKNSSFVIASKLYNTNLNTYDINICNIIGHNLLCKLKDDFDLYKMVVLMIYENIPATGKAYSDCFYYFYCNKSASMVLKFSDKVFGYRPCHHYYFSMYMYVCMYVCVYMYVCICVCMYVYACMYVCVYV